MSSEPAEAEPVLPLPVPAVLDLDVIPGHRRLCVHRLVFFGPPPFPHLLAWPGLRAFLCDVLFHVLLHRGLRILFIFAALRRLCRLPL